MATITITTTQAEDRAVQALTARYNSTRPPEEQKTALEWARGVLDHIISGWVQDYDSSEATTKGELYRRATPEDQAAIDAILDRYR